MIANKRLLIDDVISKIPGVVFFISCVTGTTTNSKRQNIETSNKASPGVSYFICGINVDVELVFAQLHDANFNVELSKVSDIGFFLS